MTGIRLPGPSKQELGQSQHPTPAEPAGGKINLLLKEIIKHSLHLGENAQGISLQAGAQMLGHMVRDAHQS